MLEVAAFHWQNAISYLQRLKYFITKKAFILFRKLKVITFLFQAYKHLRRLIVLKLMMDLTNRNINQLQLQQLNYSESFKDFLQCM